MLKIKNKTPVIMNVGASLAAYIDDLALVFDIDKSQIVKIQGVEGSPGDFNYAVYFGDVIHIDISKLPSDLYGFSLKTAIQDIGASISSPQQVFDIPRTLVSGIAVSFN